MAAHTARLDLRIEPERNERIRAAAALEGKSVSAFVSEAADARAEQVIAEHTSTVVPADFFDRLYASLDEPPLVVPALAELAARPRRTKQR